MSHHRLSRSAALGLALAALAAPTAGAQQQDPRSPNTGNDAAANTSSLAGTTSDMKLGQDLRSPDARNRTAATTSSLAATTSDMKLGQDLRSPDARQAVHGRGTLNAPAISVVSVPQPSHAPGGIDRGDAAIGVGALLGLSALSLGGSFAVARRRHASATSRQTAMTG